MKTFDELITEAEERQYRLDSWDKQAGIAVPSEAGIQPLLICVDNSLSCGIRLLLENDPTKAVAYLADAYVLIKQAEDISAGEM